MAEVELPCAGARWRCGVRGDDVERARARTLAALEDEGVRPRPASVRLPATRSREAAWGRPPRSRTPRSAFVSRYPAASSSLHARRATLRRPAAPPCPAEDGAAAGALQILVHLAREKRSRIPQDRMALRTFASPSGSCRWFCLTRNDDPLLRETIPRVTRVASSDSTVRIDSSTWGWIVDLPSARSVRARTPSASKIEDYLVRRPTAGPGPMASATR